MNLVDTRYHAESKLSSSRKQYSEWTWADKYWYYIQPVIIEKIKGAAREVP
jgi:hypothetical protein